MESRQGSEDKGKVMDKYQGKNKISKEDQIRWIKFHVRTGPSVSIPGIVFCLKYQ